jgi:putative peptide zinc metalloprotease protein
MVLGHVAMAESLFSPLWYRYSDQRPLLRTHINIQPQQYRDQTWYLLINQSNKEHFRINAAAYAFAGRCNGEYTVAQIWDSLLEALGNDAPTQNEIITVLNELDYRELLRYDVLPDIPILFKKNKDKQNKKRRAAVNPFSFRFGLWNPTKVLNQLNWLPKLIFNPITFVIWVMSMVLAAMFVSSNWGEIYAQFKSYMGVPKYLFIAWLAYPFIKAIHELGHALAVKKWGGEVSESGITLFMLTPAPYVDASAANGFRKRYQRIFVSAIGIMVELSIAALALLVFFNTQPSILRDVSFVVMVICSFSSILFNGNPLLRFDAYYVLCDSLDLPNLSTRSRQYWSNLITRLVVGKKYATEFLLAQGERKWLFTYAPLSIAFSIFLFLSIILWLGEKSFAVAVLGGIYLAYTMLLKPLYALAAGIISAVPAGLNRLTARATLGIACTCLLLIGFFVPIPYTTTAQGVVWAPDESRLRTEIAGFITQLPVLHGKMVKKNQVIAVLEDADLDAEKSKLESQYAKLETDQYQTWFTDPVKAENIGKQMIKVRADIAHCDNKISALTIRSQIDGQLVMPYQQDLTGTFAAKGQLLGYVMSDMPIQVRAALPAHLVNLVREKLHHVEVKLAGSQQAPYKANMLQLFPSASYQLPSQAMADRNGGNFTTDPNDKDAMQAVEPIILVDLALPNTVFKQAGARVNVLFNHGKEPIVQQVYHRIQQLFLKHFNTDN